MRIPYNHPRYEDIKREASRRLDQDFNQVDINVVEAALASTKNRRYSSSISECIVRPSFQAIATEWLGDLSYDEEKEVYEEYFDSEHPEPDAEELAEEMLDGGLAFLREETDGFYFDSGFYSDGPYTTNALAVSALGDHLLTKWKKGRTAFIERLISESLDLLDDDDTPYNVSTEEFFEWLENDRTYESKIIEHYDESDHYPMWNTLFEAKDRWMARKIQANIDELYDLGIGVIIDEEGELNPILFIGGAGYDFYEAHWVPMYILFGCIEPNKYPGPDEKLIACKNCGHPKFRYAVQMEVVVTPRIPIGEKTGMYLTVPVARQETREPILICTYCGAEHARSNFEWEEE